MNRLKIMVLESIINPFVFKRKPWETFFVGFIYSIVALSLSYLVFREAAGLLTIFLIVIAVLPMMYTTIKSEEDLDLKYQGEWRLLQEHAKVIFFLLFLFMGITTALVFSYIFLPQEAVQTVFDLQEKAIGNVNKYVQGSTIGGVIEQGTITGSVTKFNIFIKILINNLKVLFFVLIFSLLYGTGAIFILTWNASVIAVAIGGLIKNKLVETASMMGVGWASSYFGIITFSFLRYMFHGILEITAYFIMALAGGIMSMAIIRKDLDNDNIIADVLDLVLISLGFLLIAGIMEVYLTPLFLSK